jgi:sec-independent protein translocase protein TatC
MWRLKHTAISISLIFLFIMYVGTSLMRYLEGYFQTQVYLLTPMEGMVTWIYFSLCLTLTLGFPLLLYHVWRFTTVEVKSRWTIMFYLIGSLFLFALGLFFSLLINQTVLTALLGYGTPLYSMLWFYEFLGYNTLFTILIFQIPLMMKLLKNIGLLTRQMVMPYRRHILFATLIVTGVLTPDGTFITQLLLTFPVMILVEVGMWI